MSNDAKIAFAILQDRLELSIRNSWYDEEGNIYFLYGNEHLGEILNCSKPTVIKIKKELQKAELLEEKRMGLSQSNRLYLLKPVAEEEDVEEIHSPKKDTETLGAQQKLKNLTSRSKKSLPQEVKDFNPNDTDFSDTDFKETENKIHPSPSDTDIPEVLQQVLSKNQKRLMDDQINVDEIILHYRAHKDVLTDYQYANAVQFSLEKTPGRIQNITARLTKAVADKKKWLQQQSQPVQAPVAGRQEKLPDWYEEYRHEDANKEKKTASADSEEQTSSPRNFEAEKQALLKELDEKRQRSMSERLN
ncbi:replication initiator protein A [Planococcus lenghuensis]